MRAGWLLLTMGVACGSEPDQLPPLHHAQGAVTRYGSMHAGSTAHGHSAYALFIVQSGTDPPCPEQQVGSCTLDLCSLTPSDAPVTRTVGDAGDVSLEWAGFSEPMLPDSYGQYSTHGADPLWTAGGSPITIAATGAVAPAFELTVPAPGAFEILEPVFPLESWSTMVVSTESDLVVTWTGEQPGVWVGLYASNGVYGNVWIDCRWPAEAGSGSVPRALLEQIPTDVEAWLIVTVRSETQQTVEGWDMSLHVWDLGKTHAGLGDSSNYSVELQ